MVEEKRMETICNDLMAFIKDIFPYGAELRSCEQDDETPDAVIIKYSTRIQPIKELINIQESLERKGFNEQFKEIYTDVDDANKGDWVNWWTRVIEKTHFMAHKEQDVSL